MTDTIWRFGVVANISEFHTDANGNRHHGTKPFSPGTKVYLAGKGWDSNRDCISVIGRNRFGRVVLEYIPVDSLENIRARRIYKPKVLKIISYLEFVEGWMWWNNTPDDRREIREFIKNWKK